MANRRTLKKNINSICSELFYECIALSHYNLDVKREDIDNLMTRILVMQDEFISRISHTEPGNVKLFYKKLKEDFSAQVSDIVDSLGSLS